MLDLEWEKPCRMLGTERRRGIWNRAGSGT